MVYLDNNATTMLDPKVFDKMKPLFETYYANPNSNHLYADMVHPFLNSSADQLYNALCMDEDNDSFILTSGATESINTVHNVMLQEVLLKKTKRNQIITSSIEHPAVKQSLNYLKSFGIEVIEVPPELISEEYFADIIDKDKTLLISLIYAHNETGVIFPITEIAEIAKQCEVLIHTDATQAVGKLPIDLSQLKVNYLSCSAHKFHGPKGMGALFVRKNSPFTPLFHGGGQMGGYRSGTLNPAGIVGMGEALDLAMQNMEFLHHHTKNLRDKFEEFILSIPKSVIHYHDKDRLVNTSFISLPNVDPDYMAWALNNAKIAVSTGSACASRSMTHSKTQTRGVRFSLSRFTTEEEIDQTINFIKTLL